MKIKVRDLYAINSVMQRVAMQPMEAAAAFKIGRILRKISEPVSDAEAQRMSLLRKYGYTDGQQFTVPPERMEEFLSEFNPVLDTEVEVDVAPVPASLFPDLSPAEAAALDLIVEG